MGSVQTVACVQPGGKQTVMLFNGSPLHGLPVLQATLCDVVLRVVMGAAGRGRPPMSGRGKAS